jgi:asparagine N-glycosylation enzyme membrane subunit Stt3
MASKFVKVLAFIFAVIIGVGLANFWMTLRPEDDFMIVIGVGVVGTLAAFTSLYFLTKGSGGD